jgi:DNA-binding MarR family transcriptional regulator
MPSSSYTEYFELVHTSILQLKYRNKNKVGRRSSSLLLKEQTFGRLGALDVQILSTIKARALTEKQLCKRLRLNTLALSPLITELMLKGYVETFRKRKLYLLSREYLSITPEGLEALKKAKSPLENIIELIWERALETIENVKGGSPIIKVLLIFARLCFGKIATR